jgi:hypothetical protein
MARILFAKPVPTFAEYALLDNEHSRSPRWGAPPMEILR